MTESEPKRAGRPWSEVRAESIASGKITEEGIADARRRQDRQVVLLNARIDALRAANRRLHARRRALTRAIRGAWRL